MTQNCAGTATTDAEAPWRRLAPGMLLVEPAREIIRFIPMLVVLLFAGHAGDSGPPWGLIGTAAAIALGISRYLTTRYRIAPTVVEVRRGVFQRKHLTVPRNRVRTVDISAHPLQRILGLVKVQIGTGTSHVRREALALDGLRAAAAAPLRAELLHRPTSEPGASGPAADPATDTATDTVDRRPVASIGETELAALDPKWILFAPATLSGVVTAAFLIGLGWRILNEASVDPTRISVVHQGVRHLQGSSLWLDLVQGAAAVIIVVTALSLAGYLLSFWGYRLTRHAGGTVQVSRGLLTTRATTIEERRLHGVERPEPLLLRWVGGARLQAIATGLRERGPDRGSALLVPPAPLATVIGVETAILHPADAGRATLVQHGPAARRRRYIRALGLTAVPVVVLLLLSRAGHFPIALSVISLLGLPTAALLARDRYRNLGHQLVENRLVIRVGSLVRRRTVLAVPGVIGVTLRQSVFQRRSGLSTLTATTAAGAQHYRVPDLPTAGALDLAVRLVPQCQILAAAGPTGTRSSGTGSARNDPTVPERQGSALLRDGPGVSRLPG